MECRGAFLEAHSCAGSSSHPQRSRFLGRRAVGAAKPQLNALPIQITNVEEQVLCGLIMINRPDTRLKAYSVLSATLRPTKMLSRTTHSLLSCSAQLRDRHAAHHHQHLASACWFPAVLFGCERKSHPQPHAKLAGPDVLLHVCLINFMPLMPKPRFKVSWFLLNMSAIKNIVWGPGFRAESCPLEIIQKQVLFLGWRAMIATGSAGCLPLLCYYVAL